MHLDSEGLVGVGWDAVVRLADVCARVDPVHVRQVQHAPSHRAICEKEREERGEAEGEREWEGDEDEIYIK